MSDVSAPVDFSNTELAFQAKSDAKLRRTYWLFRMIDDPFLTKVGPKILNTAFLFHLPVEGLVRSTIFELFCGGESLEDTVEASRYLNKYNVKTILDYSVEGEKNEKGFDITEKEIIASLVHGGEYPEVALTACKLTGVGNFDLMAKIQAKKSLSDTEQKAFDRMYQRMENIATAAAKHNTPIFIDAEETWIQEVIDEVAEALMEKYNKTYPVVNTTVQLYRHDRLEYLRGLIQRAKEKNYQLGVKLVRGAYLEKENDRAEEKGYPTPIQPSKAATDKDFNKALELCIEHVEDISFCAGTHNEASAKYLTELMQKKGIPANHPNVWFAQLLGMSDHISFNLAHLGYNVAKYVPYGPVKAVMPYLIRRAEENTSVAGQASREVELLAKEVKRRKS